ncbi:Ankyrin repeat-containing domain protein [Elaphomyces granulatus]
MSSIEGGKSILDLLENTANVSACSQAMLYDKYADWDAEMMGVHLAACFGLWKSIEENGHEAVVEMLLDRNAAIESKDRFIGYTSLLFAAEHGHEAVVKLLLNRNADVESKDNHGQTPLSLAVQDGHEAVVKPRAC